MIRIAICDDLKSDRSILKKRLERFEKENDMSFLIDEYSSGKDFLKSFANQYDIVILDVEIEDINGVAVAKQIRERDLNVKIIFSTQYRQYAYDGFSVDPEGYILKLESYELFAKLLKKTLKRINSFRKRIEFSYQGETEFIELNQILYAQYSDNAVVVRLIDGSIAKTKGYMKDFLELDTENVLILVDRNTAVNLMWVDNCRDGMLTFRIATKQFKISRRRRREVEERFLNWCRERVSDD